MKNILKTPRALWLKQTKSFSQISKFKDSFLTTTNLPYIQNLYQKWIQDKSSVPESFAGFFEMVQGSEVITLTPIQSGTSSKIQPITITAKQVSKRLKVRMMIDAYRNIGHQFAKTDPLDLPQNKNRVGRLPDDALNLDKFGFTQADRKQMVLVKSVKGIGSTKDQGNYTIQELEIYLQKVYCDKIGFQYMHLLDQDQRNFIKRQLQEHIDTYQKFQLTKQEQLATLRRLAKDQVFLDFLGNKFATFKRFTLDGLNAAISSIGQLVETAAEEGVQTIQIGMAHRGRLNTLHCVLDKPAQAIFRQFYQKSTGNHNQSFFGDVKYHLGYTARKKIKGKQITISILPNPSHLQTVDPLVYGSTRAVIQQIGDMKKSLGVVIHGDAAIAGQGVVYESLGFQDLNDYTTGGIIHIVFNNQIGFTTNPSQSRSAFYCTEIAKVVDAPIIHVNGDQPDLLDKCMKIAIQYRQKFNKDIFIDIVGYRRFGHNEQDQPNFTQPIMYNKIKNKPTVFQLYSQKLVKKGIIDQAGIAKIRQEYNHILQEDYKKVIADTKFESSTDKLMINPVKPPSNRWGKNTGVPRIVLDQLFYKITTWPENFNVHPIIRKIYQQRISNYKLNQPLDWATMQSLAWATILYQGYGVRVSGQDVQRGTFSHRHALISDQQRDVQKHFFLKSISNHVRITNSHLSQYGVLGFEYGYSITNPNTLVIWEAQFGDFANGATIIIDNMISSGETKWGQQSGIVLSLPHGMDGQGPEHSQGRIERYLHLSDDNCDQEQIMNYEQQLRANNWQIVYCSTTSNYFHVLRRQMQRNYRKPLIAFNSKKLLKFKGANRPITDILQGTDFVPVYADSTANPAKVKKVLICSGQFYYDLLTHRQELKVQDVAIVRVEQIAPFPHQALKNALSPYGPNAKYYWVQQEHENYGPWNYMQPRLKLLLKQSVGFYGRPSSASTAVGALKLHKQEGALLLRNIFQQ